MPYHEFAILCCIQSHWFLVGIVRRIDVFANWNRRNGHDYIRSHATVAGAGAVVRSLGSNHHYCGRWRVWWGAILIALERLVCTQVADKMARR